MSLNPFGLHYTQALREPVEYFFEDLIPYPFLGPAVGGLLTIIWYYSQLRMPQPPPPPFVHQIFAEKRVAAQGVSPHPFPGLREDDPNIFFSKRS